MGSAFDPENDSSKSKLSMLRRKLAERLVSVKNETAMLTTFNEVNMQEIFDLRKKYKETFKAKHDVSLGFMSFFTKAVTRALKLFPDVNSMIDGDYQIKYDFCDISVAVSGPKGLMVPVLRQADNLSFSSIEKEIKEQKKNKSELSTIVAEMPAKKANEKNIKKIYFDRGIYKYHGRVKIFAETLRKNGMEF